MSFVLLKLQIILHYLFTNTVFFHSRSLDGGFWGSNTPKCFYTIDFFYICYLYHNNNTVKVTWLLKYF